MTVEQGLRVFADAVSEKLGQITHGEREEQLRGPFERFIADAARTFGWKAVSTGETRLPDRLGQPDFAVHLNGLLAGYVELKAPGVGANPRRYTGHDRDQWKRFSAVPNILYCDGKEWGLYRYGERVRPIVRISGDVTADGARAVTPADAAGVERLLRDFLTWEPFIPTGRKGKIDLKALAELLAPLCRMLRDDVTDALADPTSPLVQLARDWRKLLFPDADNEQFADAYAQTVTFALLLGRSEGADPLTLERAEDALAAQHTLLSRALQILTDPGARAETAASLDMLVRVIAVVPVVALSGPEDPWLYFYEDFLSKYDPKLRRDAGVYYTPVEVVRAQVRLIDDLLVNRLQKPLGFSNPGVVTLDPAAGTGTYLLGVIEHALGRIEREQGRGAVPGQATALATNLCGFEIMVGPYAVSELRVSRVLRDRGATLPEDGTRVYLTDTLESPHAAPLDHPLFLGPIAEQHAKALRLKNEVPVIVCLGNPPYDRHEAAAKDNLSRTGGWVRWGDDGTGAHAIFRNFLDPAVNAGHGVHVKWLYNLYVYFWRWAMWKVFEHTTASGSGVVSFITASSYLFSDAFVGMREHLRRMCDEIWIIDLGGEGRGARREENVFSIQTPVCIAVAVRYEHADQDRPATVQYSRLEGTREAKLSELDGINNLSSVQWVTCPHEWQAPFLPVGQGAYFTWPIIRDLFPWQHSGSQLFRTWPIAPDADTLGRRWHSLLSANDRAQAFKESRDRDINHTYKPLLDGQEKGKAIRDLDPSCPPPDILRYGYRSFDRQYVFADSRLGDVMKPVLWRVSGDASRSRQVFIVSQLWQVLGAGPALTVSSYVPDFHYFKGSYGGKDVIPLYRRADTFEPNLVQGLLPFLRAAYNRDVTAEDFLGYVYGVLAHPAFTTRYARELESRELRLPITKDAALFESLRAAGSRLLWLHTFGERFVPTGRRRGDIPQGNARCEKAVSGDREGYPGSFSYNEATQTLHVGDGEFRPVIPEVFEFEVSGLKVVQSWLKYRMRNPSGKRSSPLDDIHPERWTGLFTTEFLELLWVLELTLEEYPEQEQLAEAVVEGPCFRADELPEVSEEMRRPPDSGPIAASLFEGIE